MPTEESTNLAHATTADMLAAWDRGETIWSIEMGGLGPGYEQAIQVAAVEFARATLDYAPPPEDAPDFKERLNAEFDALCSGALRGGLDDKLGGITGAMYGAAKHIAWMWKQHGPAGAVELARKQGKQDRVIQVSRKWVGVSDAD